MGNQEIDRHGPLWAEIWIEGYKVQYADEEEEEEEKRKGSCVFRSHIITEPVEI